MTITDRPGRLVYRHHPFLVCDLKPDQRTPELTVNHQGFRGRDRAKEKPAGTRRVLVLGGSAAFGMYASGDDRTFPAVLERLLGEQGRTGEVLNAGRPSYESAQELILLATAAVDYAPDVVLVHDGWNDLYGSARERPDREPVPGLFLEIDQVLAEGRRGCMTDALRCSAFGRFLEGRIARLRKRLSGPGDGPRPAFDTLHDHPAALPRYRRNLRAICRLASAYGATVVLTAQPELFQRKGPVPEAERAIREREAKDAPGYDRLGLERYPGFVRAAEEVAREEGALFVDLTTAFDSVADAVFVDQVHLNDRGQEVVARQVFPVVARALEPSAGGR